METLLRMWPILILAFLMVSPDVRGLSMQQKFWDFTIIGVEANSTDENQISLDLKTVRLGRSQYAISGTLVHDVDIDDSYTVEVQILISPSGGQDYRPMPFRIPKQTQKKAMGGVYKDMLMDSLKNCSNAPQSVGGADPVFARETYIFDKCGLVTDNFPTRMQSGYYKIVIIANGPVAFVIMLHLEITSKT